LIRERDSPYGVEGVDVDDVGVVGSRTTLLTVDEDIVTGGRTGVRDTGVVADVLIGDNGGAIPL
jgi:DUF2075 family protein